MAQAAELEFVSAELFDVGTLGTEETADGLRAYFEDSVHPESLGRLAERWPLQVKADVPSVVFQEANDRDPILIGKRFVLVPSARIVLPIDAAMAFGSGRHETTQLCLEVLEELVRGGEIVYDVGCGSGILALAALKLGAGRVVGVDIDEAAIAVAQRHFPGALLVGSADCLKSSSADIVLANITGEVDDSILGDLKRVVRPDGVIVLSGFIRETAPQQVRPYDVRVLGDWECWLCHSADVCDRQDGGAKSHKKEWWT